MDEKKIYLGTNTKMYKDSAGTVEYLRRLKELTGDVARKAGLFVIPSFTSLPAAREELKGSDIRLGAQNMCWEEEGQFTGEISPNMLSELSVEIVEIGHSERRHVFRETDEEEARKVSAAVRHGFTALLCVGETLEDKNYGISDEILSIQLKKGLSLTKAGDSRQIMIAYEPVWAIGAGGMPAREDYVEERHKRIREVLQGVYGEEAGLQIPILYGGSVNKENAAALSGQPHVDGLFIGRSAWDADNFNSIIRMVLNSNLK